MAKEIKDTTIRILYPLIITPPPIIPKKTAEMTNLDWKEVIGDLATKIDQEIHQELADIAAAAREISPIPVGRFDITYFDRCCYYA